MHIDYTIKNLTCYNYNNGNIIINTIFLTKEEIKHYGSKYSIEWSKNIDFTNISNTNKSVKNLSAGIYKFRVCGNGNYGEWQTVELSQPDELKIIAINNENIYNNEKNIKIKFTGGKLPYIITYGQHLLKTEESEILLKINFSTEDYIKITDSNNCQVQSSEKIKTLLPKINFYFNDQKPPLIYDDVLQSVKFNIYHDDISFYTVKLESSDHTIEIDSDKTDLITKRETNFDYYELKSLLYPGNYLLNILDNNDHILYSTELTLFNSIKPQVNISIIDDTNINNIFSSAILPILDTILIPYNLVNNDNDIWNFVCRLAKHPSLDLYINNIKYSQKVLLYSYIPDLKNKDSIHWLKLSDDTEDWFFYIQISNGINLEKITNCLTDTITLSIKDKQNIILPGFFPDTLSQNISLIRKNLIISSANKISLEQANTLVIENESKESIIAQIASNIQIVNKYVLGSSSLIKLENYNKKILQFINDYTKSLVCYSLEHISHNGSISIGLPYYSSEIYTINYEYLDLKTKTLKYIYQNNKILNFNKASSLPSGIYIITINDIYNNKIKEINDKPYDDHYEAALSQLKELNIEPSIFDYGKILININDSSDISSYMSNIPGIETIKVKQQNIINPKITISNILEEIKVSDNNLDNSLNIIMQPAHTPCIINGPNNFVQSFDDKTQFIQLPVGVYTISGDESFLNKTYLTQNTKKIHIGPHSKETLVIMFDSYKNKCIIGN